VSAPFTGELCGYRDGRPNTSDAGDKGSVELGRLLFDRLGVAAGTPAPSRKIDDLMTNSLIDHVRTQVGSAVEVEANGHLSDFEQFTHLSALKSLSKDDGTKAIQKSLDRIERFLSTRVSARDAAQLEILLGAHRSLVLDQTTQRKQLVEQLGEESLLRLDVVVYRSDGAGRTPLLAGFSLKWSLRTDRAQDCRSQGAKMSALRRGQMPHFAAVTMEPRPTMLALLGRGSGDLDCAYHLDLAALTDAVEAFYADSKRRRQGSYDTFRRLVEQRRVRDYDEMVRHLQLL
jgi:hypothetical protein